MTDKAITPTSKLPSVVHSSPAVRAGQFLFVSGMLGISPASNRLTRTFREVDDEGRAFGTGMMSVDAWIEGVGSQFWQTFRNLGAALEAGGSSISQVVLLNWYSRAMYHHHLTNAMRSKIFEPTPSPPNTGFQVLANPLDALIQASAIGFVPVEDGSGWQRRIVNSTAVSQTVSHYDLGVQVGPFLFTGDFIPASQKLQRAVVNYQDVDSFPNSLRPHGRLRDSREETVRAQTWFLYENIREVLAENNAKLEDVIKLKVYLVDIADAAAFTEVHSAVFGNAAPVVSIVLAERLGRPEFRVAIEVTAVLPGEHSASQSGPQFLASSPAEQLLPSTSIGVEAHSYVFLSSLAGIDPQTGSIVNDYGSVPAAVFEPTGSYAVDQATGPVAAQTWSAFQRTKALLEPVGAGLDDIVALHIHLQSLGDLGIVDRVLRATFPHTPPAVTVFQVPTLPIAGSRVEVEAIAYTGDR